jgi:hypothetical protein
LAVAVVVPSTSLSFLYGAIGSPSQDFLLLCDYFIARQSETPLQGKYELRNCFA